MGAYEVHALLPLAKFQMCYVKFLLPEEAGENFAIAVPPPPPLKTRGSAHEARPQTLKKKDFLFSVSETNDLGVSIVFYWILIHSEK